MPSPYTTKINIQITHSQVSFECTARRAPINVCSLAQYRHFPSQNTDFDHRDFSTNVGVLFMYCLSIFAKMKSPRLFRFTITIVKSNSLL